MNKPVMPLSSLSLKLPNAGGKLETYRLAASRSFPTKLEGTLNRVAFSAGHVVSNPLADIDLAAQAPTLLASGAAARKIFAAGIEEWKLLIAAQLAGLGREAVKLAAAYASQRKQFGQFIGTFQAISHPLADAFLHFVRGLASPLYLILVAIYNLL